jgi:iron complex outermembrane recepter protein
VFISIADLSSRPRASRRLGSVAFVVVAFCGTSAGKAQTALPQITVTQPDQGGTKKKPTRSEGSAAQQAKPPQPTSPPATAAAPTTPSPNLNAVATSATRLGLTVRETPASVDVVNQQTIQDQGYRTNVETAQGAVGVQAIDVSGAQAGFSIRGFTFDQVNVLYNGISLGAQDLTGRTMSSFTFDRVEFLKGASALESGQGAIGGSVNYVTKEPIRGPVQNEAFVAVDSLRSVRSGYDSTGSTPIVGLDYRFVIGFDHNNSFIDDTHKDISSLATRFNYQNSDVFKSWIAFEYYKDEGKAYWGTPLVPTSFSGPFATSGVVSGPLVINGVSLGPATLDSRTLKTNYNVLDNSASATQYWLRGGFEWELAPNVTLKNQSYGYLAKRTFFDSETYTYDAGAIDRDRGFVSHDQQLLGNIASLTWDTKIFGMDNRFVAELAGSHNDIRFSESFPCFPCDSVTLIDPMRGVFGPFDPFARTSVLDTVSQSFEDRLKITPTIALIGGVRIDELAIYRNGTESTGAVSDGFPFSKAWRPVSYRAGYTWEALPKLTFYSMYGTSFDPSVAIFELHPSTPLALTSSRIYETGVKQSLWNDQLEWTLAVFDLNRRNVYEQISDSPPTFAVAGEIETKGIEVGGAVRPIEGTKLWGNIAYTHARFVNDVVNGTIFNGNTPPNVAPFIANAGASYRFEKQGWYHWLPIEIGASVRHVGDRFIFDDNAITMNAYTTADAYMFVDFDRPSLWPEIYKARLTFRVRNLTNATYAAFADPGLPDQIYLGAPRTYEMVLSMKW